MSIQQHGWHATGSSLVAFGVAITFADRWVHPRCFVQTDLASAHLLARDLEQAAALGRDAL